MPELNRPSGLYLPPSARDIPKPVKRPDQEHKFPARIGGVNERARYWHDFRFPGDVARAIVVAQREGKPLPVAMPQQCEDRAGCKVCHPGRDSEGRIVSR